MARGGAHLHSKGVETTNPNHQDGYLNVVCLVLVGSQKENWVKLYFKPVVNKFNKTQKPKDGWCKTECLLHRDRKGVSEQEGGGGLRILPTGEKPRKGSVTLFWPQRKPVAT